MKDINQIRRHLEFEISQLPQYPYLKQENIDRWIDDVIKLDPSRAIWHVDRLFRIGGSEIGPLLQSHRNKLADTISEQKYSHSSEIDIFRLKLLIDSPAPPNAAMRRGTRFEPILNEVKREELQKKYTLVRERPDLVERIVNANLPDFNWARVQVDQIWEVDGKIILLDYKFPSEGGLKTLLYEEPLMYSTQCTIGKMIANRLGIEIDEVMVSPYNMTTDSFDDINVPFDSEFEAEILHVGQAAYNKYTKGLFPTPPIPKYQIQSSEEIPNDIKEAMVKASLLRIMSKEVAESIIKEEDIYQDYLKVLSKGQSDDIRIEVATSNITGKTKKKRPCSFLKKMECQKLKLCLSRTTSQS
ncbi:hypothetical protein AB6C46_10680 [Vibrio sp. 10N.237.312.C02]|uniref:hypothetical protein n=1 Tax=Vibrio sp. 10N.237.312.C02 TaxID=3229973 RepID=UPI00354FB094